MNPSSSPDQDDQGQLGLWDAINIIIGIVIGTSIFVVPSLIFMSVSDPWMGLAVWAFGGFLALVGAFCYAELATTYPRSGGDYVYLTAAFRPWVGFLFGWAQLVVVLTASTGAMVYVFAQNATLVIKDLTEVWEGKIGDITLNSDFQYAALAVFVLTLLNILGVTLGKWTQNLLTVAKIIGLGAILVAGFSSVKSTPGEWQLGKADGHIYWGALATILVLYAYGGWNDAAFVAAEVRNRRRNIPLALLLGTGAITIIYLLINTAFLMGLGFETASNPKNDLPAALMANLLGDNGEKAIRVIIMVSALGAANGLIFAGSRVYATLGSDHRLLGWLGHWRPGAGAPILALIAQAIITLGMFITFGTEPGHNFVNQTLQAVQDGIGSGAQKVQGEDFAKDVVSTIGIDVSAPWNPRGAFETLISHTAPVFWIFFLLTGLSLFLLREKNPGLERPFSVPWYPLLPIIFCNMCGYMLYQSIIYVKWRCLFAIGLVLLGLPLYWLSRLITPKPHQPDPTVGRKLDVFASRATRSGPPKSE